MKSNSYIRSVYVPTFITLTKIQLTQDLTFLKLVDKNKDFKATILNFTFISAERGVFPNQTECYRLFFRKDENSSIHLLYIVNSKEPVYSFNPISVTEAGIIDEHVLEQQISFILLQNHHKDLLAYRYMGITVVSTNEHSVILAVKMVSNEYRMYSARFRISPMTQIIEEISIYYW